MGEVGRLENEHHDLRGSLAELDGMLGHAATDAVALAARLEEFLTELSEHFAFEENGKLFADIASLRPSFDREVTRLMRQHTDILALFTEARTAAAAGAAADQPLRKAMKMLLGHERAEMDLLQEAALTDIGGGD